MKMEESMRECRSQATFYVSSISCLETAQRGGPPMPEEAVRGPRARPRKHGMAVLPWLSIASRVP